MFDGVPRRPGEDQRSIASYTWPVGDKDVMPARCQTLREARLRVFEHDDERGEAVAEFTGYLCVNGDQASCMTCAAMWVR